jgi:hypothetical protein
MSYDNYSDIAGLVYGSSVDETSGPNENQTPKINYVGTMYGTVDLPIFVCPKDGERKLVYYYDPNDPPKCSQGHDLVPASSLQTGFEPD